MLNNKSGVSRCITLALHLFPSSDALLSKFSYNDIILYCELVHVSGIKEPDSVDENRSFSDLGLDSLLGVEVKLTLEKRYDIVLSPKEIRELTVNKLKAFSEDQGQRQNDESQKGYTVDGREFLLLRKEFQMLASEIIAKVNSVEEGSPLFIVHHMFGMYNYAIAQKCLVNMKRTGPKAIKLLYAQIG